MFYLKCLKKIFKSSPVLLVAYSLFAFSVPFFIFHSDELAAHLEQKIVKGVEAPFFHALIDKSQNYARVSRKLRTLPGVRMVQLFTPKQMDAQADRVLGELEAGLSRDFLNIGYAGMKVVFESDLKSESMELVRDYLKRLVGESSITLGELVTHGSENKQGRDMAKFFKYGGFFIAVLISIIWFLSNLLFAKTFNNQMYLMQSFNRIKFLPFKIHLLMGSVLIGTPTMFLIFANYSMTSFAFVFMALILGSVIHLKRWQWVAR